MNPIKSDGSLDTRTGPETPKGFIEVTLQDGKVLTLAINGILSISYSKQNYEKAIIVTHRRISGQNETLLAAISHDDVLRKINAQLLPGQQFPDTAFADRE